MYKTKPVFSQLTRSLLTVSGEQLMRSSFTKQNLMKDVSLKSVKEKFKKFGTIEEYLYLGIFNDAISGFVKKYLGVWKNFDKVNGLYELVINTIEKILIDKVMKSTKFNKSHTARILGISRNTLNSKLRQLKLQELKCKKYNY